MSGPLGRSVDDLELMLRTTLTVGAFNGIPGAALPTSDGPPDPKDLRIAVWADEAMAKVSAGCRDAVTGFAAKLEEAGALVRDDVRPSIGPDHLFSTYLTLLWPIVGAGLPDPVWHDLDRWARSAAADDVSAIAPRLMTASHKAWLKADSLRAKIAASWAQIFENYDAMIMPVAPTTAFAHNTEDEYIDRVVDVDGEERPYMDTLFWAGLATAPGLPSVAVPAGAVDGLPVGVQIVGPKYGDFGLLDAARTICDVAGAAFQAPPS
ncbi:MAG: hypothetical protein HKN24_05755 [Acidimicrobiales bacterium]|nr:hypothetical protein [Acidimicrobiales bacterium]